MNCQRLVITALLMTVIWLSGCQAMQRKALSHNENSWTKILVLIPQKEFFPPGLGDRRYAGGKNYFQLPAHVREKIDELAKYHHLTEVDGWTIKSLAAYCAVFELESNQDDKIVIGSLKADPDILLVQPMQYFTGLGSAVTAYPNDPYADIQFGKDLPYLRELHKYSRGENVKIGIVDSSVDVAHPDLQEQVASLVNFVENPDKLDMLHGTAVAGIIHASANNGLGGLGIAPGSQLFAYGACKRQGEIGAFCNTFDLARAIAQAMEDRTDILNLSLAGPYDPLIAALLEKALELDVIIIASKNSIRPESNFPASFPGVIAVGNPPSKAAQAGSFGESSTNDGWFQRSEWFSTRAGGGYQFFFGTSVAAAGVTGMAALIRSKSLKGSTSEWLRVATTGSCERVPKTGKTTEFYALLIDMLGCGLPYRKHSPPLVGPINTSQLSKTKDE